MNLRASAALAIAICLAPAARPQTGTVLAIGAHAGDMELTAGATLLKQARAGGRVVLLHLTLGDGGNPRMPPAKYAGQKRQEALAAAKLLGAEVRFGPYSDGMIPNDEKARLFVADEIRRASPAIIITHWRNSMHKDHANAHAIVTDAILLASLEGVVTEHPRHRGVRAIYFAENWEDAEGFQPYLFLSFKDEFDRWKEAVRQYEFVRGGISSFPYAEYYESLARVRGAECGRGLAEAFEVPAYSKKRVLDTLP